ncbi:MAG: DUF2312 domain-containing protein [Candidatus Paracaedibacteraceae bacterium]|nr:DUF2312 domain-containing protein [Candidatus Paracaedibacteraceae bacterium]
MIANNDTKLHLKNLIERIEKLEQEKANLAEHIREVYAEAKSSGFDTKVMRQVLKLRKMDLQEAQEQEELLDIYRAALGMIPEIENNN